MRKVIVILVGAVLSAVAVADTVYLRSGKSYSGRVTRAGDTVKIDAGAGVITVAESDVLHITEQETPAAATPDPEAAEPTTAPAAPVAESLPAGPVTLDDGGLELVDARTPEPILFSLMRRLAGTPAGMETFRLREQIRPWQIAAHERRRKVDGRWVAPELFAQRREAFEKGLEGLQDLARRISRLRVRSGSQQAARRTLQREYGTRLRELARSWPDEEIRSFLSGIAEYRAENYGAAELHFRRCAETHPQIAGYHQGRAMTLLKLHRGLDALQEALTTLRLCPGSTTALDLVEEAMKQTRGMNTDTDVYRRAKTVVATYAKDSRRSTRGTDWLMPGQRGGWEDSDDSLPVPACDRLTIRQGIAVAVAEDTLLVDAAVVEAAAEVVVVTGPGEYWPGLLAVPSHRSRDAVKPPVALIAVEDIVLTPVSVPAPVIRSRWSKPPATQPANAPAAGQAVGVLTLPMFAEMGREVVPLSGRLEQSEPSGELSLAGVTLAPGDGGAPVVTQAGVLAGFARGRTDTEADGGGTGGFVAGDAIATLVARARRGSRIRRRYGFSQAKRDITPAAVKGQTFVIYAIVPERFDAPR